MMFMTHVHLISVNRVGSQGETLECGNCCVMHSYKCMRASPTHSCKHPFSLNSVAG